MREFLRWALPYRWRAWLRKYGWAWLRFDQWMP
jgi:hypothetical protein